jgi:hypothetical protein
MRAATRKSRAQQNPISDRVFTTDVPARLDRLPWGRFYWLVIAARRPFPRKSGNHFAAQVGENVRDFA